jgi:N6-L-threonylcarbamoyladenine synthase
LALSLGVPLIGVHHIEAHISANYIEHPDLKPPFCCLVVSGGHSHLVRVTDYGRHTLLVRTRDDAAGEAFDKAARALGLPYPGGPHLDALAEGGDDGALRFKRPNAGGDYSFSGMKTGLLQALERAKREGRHIAPEDVAASFRKAVVDQLLDIALPAAREMGGVLALAGGVASNRLLRREAERRAAAMGLRVVAPSPRYCTDTAAMVAAAHHRIERGELGDMHLNALPSLLLP